LLLVFFALILGCFVDEFLAELAEVVFVADAAG